MASGLASPDRVVVEPLRHVQYLTTVVSLTYAIPDPIPTPKLLHVVFARIYVQIGDVRSQATLALF